MVFYFVSLTSCCLLIPLNKGVIQQLNNSWINVKRSELLQQMESLVPFLSDGLDDDELMLNVLRCHLTY